VKNLALIRYLSSLVDLRDAIIGRDSRVKGCRVRIEYVKAHVGIEGNEAADGLANLGAILPLPPSPGGTDEEEASFWDEKRKVLEERIASIRSIKATVPSVAPEKQEPVLVSSSLKRAQSEMDHGSQDQSSERESKRLQVASVPSNSVITNDDSFIFTEQDILSPEELEAEANS